MQKLISHRFNLICVEVFSVFVFFPVSVVSILVKRLSLLCVDVLQYFMYTYKILQNINTNQTQPFYKNTDMCYFMGSCFFLFVAVYQLFYICD